MKSSLLLAILLGLSHLAQADSFRIFDLGDDNGHGIYGIGVTGDVVIWGSEGCNGAGDSTVCYVTFSNGIAVSQSKTVPDLDYDNHTACNSTPAHFYASQMFCNSIGDIAWVDPRSEETYEAMVMVAAVPLHTLALADPATIPEPGSIVLFTTGLLGLMWWGRRGLNPLCP